MSDPARRPHDRLVEPMFAALDDSAASPPERSASRTRRAARVIFWLVIVVGAGATIWIVGAR